MKATDTSKHEPDHRACGGMYSFYPMVEIANPPEKFERYGRWVDGRILVRRIGGCPPGVFLDPDKLEYHFVGVSFTHPPTGLVWALRKYGKYQYTVGL